MFVGNIYFYINEKLVVLNQLSINYLLNPYTR